MLATGAADTASPAHRHDDPSGTDLTSDSRVSSEGRLSVHILALVGLLAVLVALTPTLTPWSADDGTYTNAVRLLNETGEWYESRPDHDLVTDPTTYPIVLSEVDEAGRAYPYVRHPVWVEVLRASSALFGERVGFLLPNVIGLIAAAVAAWLAAVRTRLCPASWAFWLVATGPLMVTTFGLWAHGFAAGLTGLATLGLLRLTERRSLALSLAVGVCLGVALLVRTEASLFVAAAAVALVAARGPRMRRLSSWVDPALVAVLPALALVTEKAWIAAQVQGALVSTAPDEPGPSSWLAGRAQGAWRVLFTGAYGSLVGEALTVAALVATAAGAVGLVRGRGRPAAGLVGLGLALVVVVSGAVPQAFLGGILPAWPVMAGGVAMWLWSVKRRWASLLPALGAATPASLGTSSAARPSSEVSAASCRRSPRALLARLRASLTESELMLAVLVVVFLLGVLATQYVIAGGKEWGGRYLALAAVPLAVLAGCGLIRAAGASGSAAPSAAAGLVDWESDQRLDLTAPASRSRRERSPEVVRRSLAVVVVIGGLVGLQGHSITLGHRDGLAEQVASARAIDDEVDVVVSLGLHVPRSDLSHDARTRWRLPGRGGAEVEVAGLLADGAAAVGVFGNDPADLDVPGATAEQVDDLVAIYRPAP